MLQPSIGSWLTAMSLPSCAGRRTRLPSSWVLVVPSRGLERRGPRPARAAGEDERRGVSARQRGAPHPSPDRVTLLAATDWQTINPAWGADDTPAWQGHGTRMAGVTLYGDLVRCSRDCPIAPPYRSKACASCRRSRGPQRSRALRRHHRRGDRARRGPGPAATARDRDGRHERDPAEGARRLGQPRISSALRRRTGG